MLFKKPKLKRNLKIHSDLHVWREYDNFGAKNQQRNFIEGFIVNIFYCWREGRGGAVQVQEVKLSHIGTNTFSENMKSALKKVRNWSRWGLGVNQNKTDLMLFATRNKEPSLTLSLSFAVLHS